MPLDSSVISRPELSPNLMPPAFDYVAAGDRDRIALTVLVFDVLEMSLNQIREMLLVQIANRLPGLICSVSDN